MTFLKTLRSNPRISHSLQRAISSDASAAAGPKQKTLSSLFSTRKSSRISDTPKPSTVKKTSLSSIFATNPSHSNDLSNPKKPSTNGNLPKKPSTNGELPNKDKRVVAAPGRRSRPMEDKEFPKELSPEATMLVSRLIEDGYVKDANFAKGEEQLEPQRLPANNYSRHFLKNAAEKFGRDHQEVAKWLSGSELKKVALFGCPSIERKSVFAAKRLRAFFRIQEDVVCRGCKLRSFCRFTNQRVGTMDKVVLEDVMRLITVYTLDSVPPELVVPDELKSSVGKLVKEAVNLSN